MSEASPHPAATPLAVPSPGGAAQPAVRALDLLVEAGGARLLGPVELVVEEGAHVLLVGRSGSGKTTLLRALAGLARPSRGRIELFGRTVSDGPRHLVEAEDRRIGMLFQGGAHWPHMSARGALEFVLARRGLARAELRRRAEELLARVELLHCAERRPGTLSGGEAQRLALARALASDPRLLLLDEPLGPLDAELRATMLEQIDLLQRELGLTVIHVTHDPAEAAGLATQVLRLAEGRLVPERAGAPARGGARA